MLDLLPLYKFYDGEGVHDGLFVWVCELNNGERIYNDPFTPPAWLRLKEYLREKNLSITNIGVKLASHEEWPFPPNQRGYFCSRGAFGALGGSSFDTLVIGWVDLDKNIINTISYRCPELIPLEQDERDLIINDQVWLSQSDPTYQ